MINDKMTELTKLWGGGEDVRLINNNNITAHTRCRSMIVRSDDEKKGESRKKGCGNSKKQTKFTKEGGNR